MMLPNHFMCKYENTEFEEWAASRGGLKRARRSDEYSRRVDMYFKWRKSKEFKAWVMRVEGGHGSKCCGHWDVGGEGYMRVPLQQMWKAHSRIDDFVEDMRCTNHYLNL